MLKKVGGIPLPRVEDQESYVAAILAALKQTMETVDQLVDEVEELKSQGGIPRMIPGYQNNR